MNYPTLPCKVENSLKWGVEEGEGWYTSIDIQESEKYGYDFDVMKGYYWDRDASVFKDYIDTFFEKKKNATKGSPSYLLAKLFMNGLYGKMIQKVCHEVTEVLSGLDEIWGEVLNNDRYITDMIDFNGEYVVKYESYLGEEKQEDVRKPSYLGSFVLSYSRKIMNDFYFKMNPTDSYELAPYYGDTDSLIMSCKVPCESLLGKNLGNLSYDLCSKTISNCPAKIIRYIGISPKTYLCDYMVKEKTSTGEIVSVIRRHIRAKGVVRKAVFEKHFINYNEFERMMNGEKTVVKVDKDVFLFSKINFKVASTKKDMNGGFFNITKSLPYKEINKDGCKIFLP